MTVPERQQWVTLEDGLDKLKRSSAPIPKPGKDEVLVEISAVSLNYRDTEGESLHQHPLPLFPLSDHSSLNTPVPT